MNNELIKTAQAVVDTYKDYMDVDKRVFSGDVFLAINNLANELAKPQSTPSELIERCSIAVLDLQPLGISQNNGTRLWQMYRTADEAKESIKAVITQAVQQPSNLQMTKGEINEN